MKARSPAIFAFSVGTSPGRKKNPTGNRSTKKRRKKQETNAIASWACIYLIRNKTRLSSQKKRPEPKKKIKREKETVFFLAEAGVDTPVTSILRASALS
jgi:hypothetical protein